MRRMVTGIAGGVGLLLACFGTAGADDPDCGAISNPFVVDDGPGGDKAKRVAAGFDCDNVALEIVSNLNITVTNLIIEAKSVLIKSNDPAQRIQMVNNFPSSTTRITAVTGDITLSGASVKAHNILAFQCDGVQPLCKFTADQSDIIAALDFQNPDFGGRLTFVIRGPISIHTTNLHGGDILEMQSVNSSITLICGGSGGGCKDPLLSPIPDIILDQCEDPAKPGTLKFPCDVEFPDAASLTGVCIPAPFVHCNGGRKEKRFTAATDIDITGSTIVSDEHVTFTCLGGAPGTGLFKGSGATLDMDKLRIDCKGKIDISNAKITTPTDTTIVSGTGCALGALCIDASGAQITARPMRLTARAGNSIIDACAGTFTVPGGTSFPILNNDASPPYAPNVRDTTAECTPRAAATFCNDNGCIQNP